MDADRGNAREIFTGYPTPRQRNRAQRFFRPIVYAMKIKYFQDTDTRHIEFRQAEVCETKDLDENTLLDLDAHGNICAITIEHASERAEIPKFSYEQIIT